MEHLPRIPDVGFYLVQIKIDFQGFINRQILLLEYSRCIIKRKYHEQCSFNLHEESH